MIQYPPKFGSGNRHFAKALNELGEYAMRHGVHASGVPGWIKTVHGWRPPFSIGSGGDAPWDLRPGEDTGDYTLVSPSVIKRRVLPPEFLQISYDSDPNGSVEVEKTGYIVARIESLSDPSINVVFMDESEIQDSGIYSFTGSQMTVANIPLWRFDDDEDLPYSVPVATRSSSTFGVKLVPSTLLHLSYTTAVDEGEYKLAIDLI